MNRRSLTRFGLHGLAIGWFLCVSVGAVEPWSDDRLTVRENLQFWYDCSRQNAGRSALQLPPLGSGNAADYLIDGSGWARHLTQPLRAGRPRFRQEFSGAFLSFDGQENALIGSNGRLAFTNLTVFLVAAPRSNAGEFRAFLSLNQMGANDYTTGLNLDLGPFPSAQVSLLNAEGSGFGGAAQLLKRPPMPFRGWHVFELQSQMGPQSVRLFVDGQIEGSRERQDAMIHADEMVLGARHYSNTGEPPFVQGFYDGEIAECLLYDRVLSEPERLGVEQYLNKKYGLVLNHPPELAREAKPLNIVSNPPSVQLLVPGFTVRELPLSLGNVNNIRYRPDGKLVALGYNGRIYLLTDTNGDGLEDQLEAFWTNNSLRAPIGMALTPPGYARGQGVFVASKGKVSLIVDTNGDDRADQELIVAEGWKELSHGVDALGVALDQAGNIYLGLGTASFTEPYLVDKTTGQSKYQLSSERGTILKVSPDFQRREIVCTGIRFSVGLAFNRAGDLFCTDQEGATWLPNGNPLDELLWVQPGRHYGFPPRHPKYLPNVVDEPSLFDYAPQHQSTCGLVFNEPVNGGPTFGPSWWAGDALVCGYSRGKIWRTKLARTATGYVAQNQLLASLPTLTVDACPSPQGDLVVSTHGGEPDWGSGPAGQGHLYKISYDHKEMAQPVLAWSSGPSECTVVFDRPLDPGALKNLAQRVEITQGKYVSAGDRFEMKRPGYVAVYSQLSEPRYEIPVQSASFTPDFLGLTLHTKLVQSAVQYGLTLKDWSAAAGSRPGVISQVGDLDLAFSLNGLMARWEPSASSGETAGAEIWLPHVDLAAARQFTVGSAPHEAFWSNLRRIGTLTLEGQLDLWEMLQPAIQPGARLDYERPAEDVTVDFMAAGPFKLQANGSDVPSHPGLDRQEHAQWKTRAQRDHWLPVRIVLPTSERPPQLTAAWFTADDPRPRAFPLRRFLLPWAKPGSEPGLTNSAPDEPKLAGGNWLHGRRLFFGETVACYKCHRIRGEGNRVGPDLSNLVQRDYASVLKDIVQPSAALNPDHLAYHIELKDGDEITAVIQNETSTELMIADATGSARVLPRSRVQSVRPSIISLMPEGLDKVLSAEELKDLMMFLLRSPLEAAPFENRGEPPPRQRNEFSGLSPSHPSDLPASPLLQIVLCAGPKDHGPGEHDYPLWQTRWAKLLALADHVQVSTAWEWPSPGQWHDAQVVVFYSDNPAWNRGRAQELESFLSRGGGAVYVHFAVDGHQEVEALAASIGLAWRGGASKFRHGPLALRMVPGPLTAGLKDVSLVDESYWDLVGSVRDVQVVGSALEDGQERPLVWTRSVGNGRVFVCIPGHYTWTFDDPMFRLLLLRGISWAGGQTADRLSELATIGARMAD